MSAFRLVGYNGDESEDLNAPTLLPAYEEALRRVPHPGRWYVFAGDELVVSFYVRTAGNGVPLQTH